MVFLGLWAMGMPMVVALLLAGVATATDPAATEDVIRESKAKGPFSRLVSGIVAVDDAWGLLLFSILLAAAQMMTGNGGEAMEPSWEGLREIGGAIVVGGGLGVVMAFLTGRIEKGEPTVLEAVGFVMLVCGVSLYCGVSFILAAMTMGTVVSLLAKHHRRPFHVIENIEFPFMIVFFVLAGAALEPRALAGMGWYGFGYILLRAASRLVGGWLGGAAAGVDDGTRRLVGMALMPQAGVALGMALLAAEQIPSVGGVVLQAAIGSTVIFEVVGPVFTRHALNRCGETRD
jgi:Kef-type K+ transport system membrane component KefB